MTWWASEINPSPWQPLNHSKTRHPQIQQSNSNKLNQSNNNSNKLNQRISQSSYLTCQASTLSKCIQVSRTLWCSSRCNSKWWCSKWWWWVVQEEELLDLIKVTRQMPWWVIPWPEWIQTQWPTITINSEAWTTWEEVTIGMQALVVNNNSKILRTNLWQVCQIAATILDYTTSNSSNKSHLEECKPNPNTNRIHSKQQFLLQTMAVQDLEITPLLPSTCSIEK